MSSDHLLVFWTLPLAASNLSMRWTPKECLSGLFYESDHKGNRLMCSHSNQGCSANISTTCKVPKGRVFWGQGLADRKWSICLGSQVLLFFYWAFWFSDRQNRWFVDILLELPINTNLSIRTSNVLQRKLGKKTESLIEDVQEPSDIHSGKPRYWWKSFNFPCPCYVCLTHLLPVQVATAFFWKVIYLL